MIDEILTKISTYGITTVMVGGLVFIIATNYKAIVSFILTTIQAEALVNDLRLEIESLKEQVKDMQADRIKDAANIARLEERITMTAKNRMRERRPDTED